MPKKGGRKVTAQDLFAPPQEEPPTQPPARPQQQRQSQQQRRIQIPQRGKVKMMCTNEMAPPGTPQTTMMPVNIQGGPPQIIVPIGFVLPPHARPGMEVEVDFQVLGPPQPVNQQRQQAPMPPLTPSAAEAPAPPPAPPPLNPPAVEAVLVIHGREHPSPYVAITWTSAQEMEGCTCRLEVSGPPWPPKNIGSPIKKSSQKGDKKGNKGGTVSNADFRALLYSAVEQAEPTATDGKLILPCGELRPGAEYYFRAVAKYPPGLNGEPVVSDATAAVTAPATVPSQVGAISFGSASRTSFKVKWKKPFDGGSAMSAYRLEVWREAVAGLRIPTHTYEGSELEHKVSGVLPGTTYCCSVCAVNAQGAGATSEIAEITAKAGVPSAPVAPTLAGGAPKPDRMMLMWNEPEGNGAEIES